MLARVLNENKCGDAECEEYRLDAAISVLRGIPTGHKANAELLNATEDAWRDACSTEFVRAERAEARIAELEAKVKAGERMEVALLLALARDTGHPNHDWQTCDQYSCIEGRAALAAYRKAGAGE